MLRAEMTTMQPRYMQISDGTLLVVWLVVNIVTLTLGWTNYVALLITGAITAAAQWMVLRWAFRITWPWLVLGPIVWFYAIYGGSMFGGYFLPLFGGDYRSIAYSFCSALVPGLLIGLSEFVLFKRHLRRASLWVGIHLLAFALAAVISPSGLNMYTSGQASIGSTLFLGACAALSYAIVTGLGLLYLKRANAQPDDVAKYDLA